MPVIVPYRMLIVINVLNAKISKVQKAHVVSEQQKKGKKRFGTKNGFKRKQNVTRPGPAKALHRTIL